MLAYLGVLAWQLRRLATHQSASRALLAVLLLQLLTGLSNVVLDWPLFAAVLHTGGAAALLVILVGLLSGARVSRTVLN